MGLSLYDKDRLNKELREDKNLIVIVPKTAYFTSSGLQMRWVIPDELLDDDEEVFKIVKMLTK